MTRKIRFKQKLQQQLLPMMTLTDVDSATKLRRRIMELKAHIEGESTELQTAVQQWRDQFTPGTIARQVVDAFLDKNRPDALKDELAGLAWQLPLRLLTNVLVRDPRAAFLLKYVAPIAIPLAPKIWNKASKSLPSRVKVYGMLRKRVIKMRARFRVEEEDASWFI